MFFYSTNYGYLWHQRHLAVLVAQCRMTFSTEFHHRMGLVPPWVPLATGVFGPGKWALLVSRP